MIGLHPNISAEAYHLDPAPEPSLSSSIAKVILQQTPRHAWQAHPRLNPQFEPDDDGKFSLGAVAHELLLGKGAGFVVVEESDWRKKSAQEAREAAREAGKRAVLRDGYDRAWAAAQRARNRLFDAGVMIDSLEREIVGIWQDEGAWCRCMIDALDVDNLVVYDAKFTSAGLADDTIARQIDTLGYDISAGHYIRGLEALLPGTSGRWRWRWIVVEDAPPHECRIIEADRSTLEIGDRKAATALVKWARCMKTGEWPGYPTEIATGGLTDWAVQKWISREEADPDCAVAPFSSQQRTVERPAAAIVWGA